MSSSSAVIPFSPSFCFDSSFPFPFPERTFLPQVSAARSSPTITHVIIPHISAMTEMGLRIILLYRNWSRPIFFPILRACLAGGESDCSPIVHFYATSVNSSICLDWGKGRKKEKKKQTSHVKGFYRWQWPINYSYRASIRRLIVMVSIAVSVNTWMTIKRKQMAV